MTQGLFRIGLTAMIVSALAACAQTPAVTQVDKSGIIPTTGTFTPAEEAFYEQRFRTLQEAFASGADTTRYDTEVAFGQDLVAKPLPRATSSTIPADVIETMANELGGMKSSAFMIYEDGKVVVERYYGDTTADSLIVAKSLAKPLGAVAIGRAIEAGYVESLEQPLADFIIEWKDTDKAAITMRQMLGMRTGLLPQGAAPEVDDVLNRAYLHPRHDEVIIHEYPLVDEPGSRYEYSNANSELVAVIIERATGMEYEDWLAEQVLAPLGMAGGRIWLNREGGMAHSGCCVSLPAENYLKLAALVLNKGEWNGEAFLSPEFMAEMTRSTPDNIHAGMGVYLGTTYAEFRGASNPETSTFGATYHSEPYLDEDLLLFDGNGHQVAYILPSRGIVAMRLGTRPPRDMRWDNAAIPNTLLRAIGG